MTPTDDQPDEYYRLAHRIAAFFVGESVNECVRLTPKVAEFLRKRDAQREAQVRAEAKAEAFDEAADLADQLFQRSVARMFREKAAALRAKPEPKKCSHSGPFIINEVCTHEDCRPSPGSEPVKLGEERA